jgi:hypothetical protein
VRLFGSYKIENPSYIETVKPFVNIGKHEEVLSVLSVAGGGIISMVSMCLRNTVFHHTIRISSLFILKSVLKVPLSHAMHSSILNEVSIRILVWKILQWYSWAFMHKGVTAA